ncbi:MAG: glycerophosphodiester phosphodiesterase [Pirellulaceae bacterium]|nr:glycerophosphodiester phosphodiesterase [Pirellulaceae bacterium]
MSTKDSANSDSRVTRHQTLVFGHRGASRDAPENTLAAFRLAWQQSADGVEGDFHFTADGQIVCIHDYDTQRTGGRSLIVAESSLAELRDLEYGSWKAARFHGERLPLLSDIMRELPKDRWLVMELKTGPDIVPLLKAVLQAEDLPADRLLVIAFDEQTVQLSKRLLPNVAAHWLTDYRFDETSGQWHPTADEVISTLSRCGADGLGSEHRPNVVTDRFVGKLRAAGIDQFHIWTVDEPDWARYYRDLGAFAITSNCPGDLRQALAEPASQ